MVLVCVLGGGGGGLSRRAEGTRQGEQPSAAAGARRGRAQAGQQVWRVLQGAGRAPAGATHRHRAERGGRDEVGAGPGAPGHHHRSRALLLLLALRLGRPLLPLLLGGPQGNLVAARDAQLVGAPACGARGGARLDPRGAARQAGAEEEAGSSSSSSSSSRGGAQRSGSRRAHPCRRSPPPAARRSSRGRARPRSWP
jgi:hypothetical protein